MFCKRYIGLYARAYSKRYSQSRQQIIQMKAVKHNRQTETGTDRKS